RLLALCSPSTHVMASTTLLLPQPLGPTMAVTPWSNASSDRSGKLLNPAISRRLSLIYGATTKKPLVLPRERRAARKRLGSLRAARFSGYEDWTTAVCRRY